MCEVRHIDEGVPPDCLRSWTVSKAGWSDFSGTPCYRQTREALQALQQCHCAYCERLLNAKSRVHIEHRIPKDFRARLTFDWTNLLAVCGSSKHCGHAKGGNRTPILDPRLHDPSVILVLRPTTGELRVPDEGICAACQALGSQTIEVLNLNHNSLKNQRRNSYAMWEEWLRGDHWQDVLDQDFGSLLISASRNPLKRAFATGCPGCGG